MKNSLRNLKLWQQKRNELPVSDDMHSDWLDMGMLLDKHMPVNASTAKVSWFRSKKVKTFALTIVSFSAAAMVYVVSQVYQLKNKNLRNEIHYGKHKHPVPGTDKHGRNDSAVFADSTFKRDTAYLPTANNNSKIDSVDLVKPKIKPIYPTPDEKSTSSFSSADSNNVENSSDKEKANSPNGKALMNIGNKVSRSLTNKPNNHSSIANSNDKRDRDKETADRKLTSHNLADAPDADKLANKNVPNPNSTNTKLSVKNLTHNAAKVTNTNSKNARRPSTKNPFQNNNLNSKGAIAVTNIPGKSNKTMLYAKVGRNYINTPAPSGTTGQMVSANAQGTNFRRHRNKNNNDNLTAKASQSTGKVTTHRTLRRQVKDDDDLDADDDNQGYVLLTQTPPKTNFDVKTTTNDRGMSLITPLKIRKQSPDVSKGGKKSADKQEVTKAKSSSGGNPIFSKMDWGLLLGVNASSSFSPKNQNSNFYGAAPVDFFVGLSAAYNFNTKWALNTQAKVFSPQSISYNYTHPTHGAIDSPQSLQITSARKIYLLEVPLQLRYSINNYLSIMAGPMISIPVKQSGISNTLLTTGPKKDSVYFARVVDTLSGTKYLPKLNFGLSGGVNFQYKRLNFGATWNQSLTGYQISSDFGTFKTTPGTFQFTIGWKLNKTKP
jgi:hypothetical protein